MRIFKNTLFFLILLLLLAVLSGWVSKAVQDKKPRQAGNKTISRLKKEPDHTIDVLVLGDSLSYSSVAPLRIWKNHGITSFVCGQPGQKVSETYDVLKTALEYQMPKVLILETNVLFRKQGGMSKLEETVAEAGNNYFPVFEHHDIWKSFLADFTEKIHKKKSYKGFEIRGTVRSYEKGSYMKESTKSKEMENNVERYLEDIVSLCKEKNIKVLLLSTPSPKNYNYRKHNTLKEYAQKNALAYLDMNLETDRIGLDWKEDSLDRGDHLNLSGACKVTDYLGKYLAEPEWQLTDHRGDAAYQAWENASAKFEKIVSKRLTKMKGKP